ncbi:MAG: hypothetical protein ACR2MO_00400 [Acidimicrobiales bacterium]
MPTAGRVPRWVGPAAWIALVAAALVLGAGVRADQRAHIGAAPFVGTWSALASWRLLPALALAAAALGYGPRLATGLRWRAMLVASGAGALAWAVALAWADGARSISAPLATRYEYLAAVPRVDSVGSFLRGFVEAVPTYPTHVKSHPPGMVLLLWALDRLGLRGAGPATVVVLVAGALAGVAALVALRELAGEARARRAAPFVAFAPAAVFMATSSDALFAGVSASAIALVVLATGRDGARSTALAAAGGLLLGATVFLSYGLALLSIVPAAVCVHRRRLDVAAVVAVVAAAVALAFAAGGFWWLDGLGAAHAAYGRGLSGLRPYGYFLLANVAAFAVVVGPATAAALPRLRDRRAWLLVGGALLAVLAADVSGLSKGEVERIWLPFAPWVVLATGALAARTRPWLAAQLGTGLALQVLLRSPW